MVTIEKIEGSKVTVLAKLDVDKDKDDLKSVTAELRLTLDLVELFNEVTKKELPDFLKPIFQNFQK